MVKLYIDGQCRGRL